MSKRIFLDYASATPLDKSVAKAMAPFVSSNFGNPSAIYEEGREARVAVQKSRQTIAGLLNIRSEEIVFTGSGTEADNLAVIGVFNAFRPPRPSQSFRTPLLGKGGEANSKPHIITTNIEHPAILEACKFVEREGGEVSYVKVEENGIVDPKKIAAALRPTTILVSVMYANSEVGTIQPLREISRIIEEFRKSSDHAPEKKSRPDLPQPHEFFSGAGRPPYFHTDASQAANYLDLSFQKLGVDMMTLDASKIYGPKGIGLLAARQRVSLLPVVVGGGQENGLRAGTENVPAIVGMSAALLKSQASKEAESKRLSVLRDYFFEQLMKIIPEAEINGDRDKRLPNNINICVPDLNAEFAVIELDIAGVSCSFASSCTNLSENSYSYVIDSIGKDGKKCRESSLRFSLGRQTTKRELDLTLRKIQSIIEKK